MKVIQTIYKNIQNAIIETDTSSVRFRLFSMFGRKEE